MTDKAKKLSLSEAAAEILKSSASSAPAQPQQHLEGDGSGLGTGQDLGGDTPSSVAANNPRGVTGVRSKEPGPAPRIGKDPKKKLQSNNQGIDVDKQEKGPNTVTVDAYHKTDNDGQDSDTEEDGEGSLDMDEEVYVDEDGNVINPEDILYEDEEGNLYDAEGNPVEFVSEGYDDEDEENDEQDSDEQYDDEGVIEEEQQVVLFDREAIYESFKQELEDDIGSLLESDSSLTEDFKTKAKTIFEAAVMARVDQMADSLESAFIETLAEAVEEIKGDLTEKTNDYLSYVAEQWLADNEIAVEKSLRTELTEDFMNGLKNLFVEHYIDIPDEKVDLIEELSEELSATEEKLDEEIEHGIEMKRALKEYKAAETFATVCEGLTDVQVDKMKSLVENLEFTTEEEYKDKLEILRENYCFKETNKKKVVVDAAQKQTTGSLHETVEIEDEKAKKTKVEDPMVAQMVSALDRTSPTSSFTQK
jgi:hypothetical protein